MGLFTKPEVVIIKESSDAKEYLKHLEELYRNEKAEEDLKKKIEKEIRYVKAGIIGEDNILFELKNSGMNMYVLHDIYLECGDLSAQIDFYVITPKINFIIECKNLFGNIEINNKGDFIRTFEYGNKKYREGIYSPITQNERHLLVIKNKKMEDCGFLRQIAVDKMFNTYHKSLVVLANPKTVLNDRYAKKEIREKVIRADQLAAVMKRMCNESKEFPSSRSDMEEQASKMLGRNVEQRKDYLKKYKELLDELQGRTEKTVPDNVKPNCCPRCGGELVKRKGRYGEFYGCSKFPQCRFTDKA